MRTLKIGIVGGSIAGCSAAILLGRAGHAVTVFERTTGDLVGRGGGIATTPEVFGSLIAQDVIDPDMPHLMSGTMPFVARTAQEPYAGYRPWQFPLSLAAFHWSALWRNLRARVPDDDYRQGARITGAENLGDRVRLDLAGGGAEEFDLAIFADGYRSLGRSLIFPDAELDYRGYMLWRGLLRESELADSETLGDTMPRVSYPELQGNLVAYFVPGADGATAPGERLVNWAAYVGLPEPELEEFMVDASGRPCRGTIPPGAMRPTEEDRLKDLVGAELPDYFADIIARTPTTYVQLIYTARVPAYHSGRICLIGDAGAVAQPFTGSGVFKGYNNVTGLLEALSGEDALDAALQAWSTEQTALSDRLLALGEQMERAFIFDPLDLRGADGAAVEAWWKAAVSFPEDFSYQSED